MYLITETVLSDIAIAYMYLFYFSHLTYLNLQHTVSCFTETLIRTP